MYYLAYGLLYLISLLPFWVLYLLSDLAYFIIYRVVGYRKDIVLSNLALAFPDKNLEERKAISKKFYKNFADNFIEVIKLFSISKKELNKRFVGEFDTVNKYYATGRNVQLHLGHFFNWELANLALSDNSEYPVLVVYMPIANKAINKIFYDLRTRFSAKMISATAYIRDFKPYIRKRFSMVLAADQNAGSTITAYWLPFFGKRTPFVTGPEKNARLTNAIPFYSKFIKTKRGYYTVKFTELTLDARSLPEGEITKRMITLLEDNIREQPENYLWTHRRWKHTFDPAIHKTL